MTEKQFREKMFKTKMEILKSNSFTIVSWLNISALLYHSILFDLSQHYFTSVFNRKNQLMRIDALSLFEEYCITEGIYKEF